MALNIGIKGIEIYIPGQSVSQSDLEKYDNVQPGRYTIGLGQLFMSYVTDREDVNSICLTVLSNLLKNYNISKDKIGRLEVGSESSVDKSKSIKTVLMDLFEGNNDIEGIDSTNACYGGTSGVLNAINWISSSYWDGRDAIVVCGDIAIYDKGNARPTGGAGAIALWIGPDAPIVFEKIRSTHMENCYDFYKPNFLTEYPIVKGQYSLECYIKALDMCYKGFSKKVRDDNKTVNVCLYFDYNAFHVPNSKLVAKSFGRLFYNDYLSHPELFKDLLDQDTIKYLNSLTYDQSLRDKKLEKLFMNLSQDQIEERVNPSLKLAKNIGNTYTASIWSSLGSLIYYVESEKLKNKRISLFSYGSGFASTLMSVIIKGDVSKIAKILDLDYKIGAGRKVESPEDYLNAIKLRENVYLKHSVKPVGSITNLPKGTYYLTEIDNDFKRLYSKKN